MSIRNYNLQYLPIFNNLDFYNSTTLYSSFLIHKLDWIRSDNLIILNTPYTLAKLFNGRVSINFILDILLNPKTVVFVTDNLESF